MCKKTQGKIIGIEAPSSRNLKRIFYEKFNKDISHTTINKILNRNLTKPLKVVNTFLSQIPMKKKEENLLNILLMKT